MANYPRVEGRRDLYDGRDERGRVFVEYLGARRIRLPLSAECGLGDADRYDQGVPRPGGGSQWNVNWGETGPTKP